MAKGVSGVRSSSAAVDHRSYFSKRAGESLASIRDMTDTTYRTVTPYLLVDDADGELTFLQSAFAGIERQCSRTPDGQVMHAEMALGDSLVMIGQCNTQYPSRPCALYLWVDDVDATFQKALDAGGTVESAPEDKPYGHRNAGVIDPNGNTWWIAAPVRA
jgi:PhnB protein